ncbi:unnamed protein product [Somion occarium]|uniref:Phosphoglycerate mutase n=1 Tax=Somion occarium TaxID=3059160 RepID=A0ABP1DU72_9APHY
MLTKAVPGYFVQGDQPPSPASIIAVPPRFGLKNDGEDGWHDFKSTIDELNATDPANAEYKVLFLGRHGEGYHNLGRKKYGKEEWMRYYSLIGGDDEMTWAPDAQLTPLGHTQAYAVRDAWKEEIKCGIPIPQRCYVSPLRRALETWTDIFSGNGRHTVLPGDRRIVTIVENCRESYGLHPCDMRLSRSKLQAFFPPPMYQFEPGFTEEDVLWSKDERECEEHIRQRARYVLDMIFAEPEIYVSVTTHGWFIRGLLAEIDHAPHAIPTGGVLPVVIRREWRHVN